MPAFVCIKCKTAEIPRSSEYSICDSCYQGEKAKKYSKRCGQCGEAKLLPDSKYSTCFDCVKGGFRECVKCHKVRVRVDSKFTSCFECSGRSGGGKKVERL